VLKNALDHIFPEWGRKPIGFVSYGNAGGARGGTAAMKEPSRRARTCSRR